MSHGEHGHAEHGYADRPHKPTSLWLIVTTIIVCISVPFLVLALTLPKLP